MAGWALDFVEDDSDSLLIGAVEVAGVVDRADIVAGASGVSDTVSPAWRIAGGARLSGPVAAVVSPVSCAEAAPPVKPTRASPTKTRAEFGIDRNAARGRSPGTVTSLQFAGIDEGGAPSARAHAAHAAQTLR